MVRWRAALSFVDPIDRDNRDGFDSDTKLILCEGKSDAAFFRDLLANRGIQGYRIGFPEPDHTALGHGRPAMRSYLESAVVRPGFKRHVKTVVVVSDNDLPNAFDVVKDLIPEDSYARPDAVRTIAREDNKIDTAIVLVPFAPLGALEALILEALEWGLVKKQALQAYRWITGVSRWPHLKQDKMRIRCIIAASCEKNPDCSLTWMWKASNTGIPFSLSHTAFTPLATYLGSIP